MPLAEDEVSPFCDQEYKKIMEQLKDCKQFEDPEFLTEKSSLAEDSRGMDIHWKRPEELMEDAVFLTNATPFDVDQGALDDCWFLAPVAYLTLRNDFFNFVIPPGQDLEAGILHFRFWSTEDEMWVDVVIDTRLPAVEEGRTGIWNLIYAKPGKDKQFWCPLLEKAYAKFKDQSYESLNRGNVSEGLENLTRFKCHEKEISQVGCEQLLNTIKEAEAKGLFVAFNVKCEHPVWKRRHIYNIYKSHHDEGNEKCQLEVLSTSSKFSETDETDSRQTNDSLPHVLRLSLEQLCEIGSILFSVSPK